ncbi:MULTISPECIES: hypothetical protein [Cyanophyceae]|uniref:hypothetical protein n=1 Tax=Cyanophyceae TaxID=3028117 RepID=UPI001685DCBE|nr:MULTISPECIES: hypothetical protein [Cyanophyceae]MBD1918595.1 hypothetical protein [Phormidium sp. FACHB-77]MBD2031266.1 hypothetical protein [Phormidium sp. FACHB-322]MBD2052333.1 hypothetical protein [Leptolyngbya sp. FACHB-60]
MPKKNQFSQTLVLLGLFLLVATTACTENSTAPTPAPGEADTSETPQSTDNSAEALQADDVGLTLTDEGLQVINLQTGSTTPLAFDTDMAISLDAVTQILGEPEETGENSECPSGPLTIARWSNGLALNAADDTFVGWAMQSGDDDTTLTTVSGIGIGSTRQELEEAYTVEVMDSSLGVEFSAGDLFGLLTSSEPTGTITSLWAGVACNFR